MNFLRRLWKRLTCEHHFVLDPDASFGEPTMWAKCVYCRASKRL